MERVGDNLLADAKRILSYPPDFRRGVQQLLKFNPPAAGNSFTYPVSGDFWDRPLTVAFTFATSATAANRSVSLGYQDNDGYQFLSIPIILDLPASSTVSQYGALLNFASAQGASSIVGEGSVTTPGALATIASITSLPAGTYNVTAVVTLAGTLAQATDANNLRIDNASTTVYALLDNTIAAGPQVFGPYEVTVGAGATIAVRNIGAGTAGSIYAAQITATPSTNSGLFAIPDITLESGWKLQIAVANIQAADQLSGISILAERYGSKYARGGYYAEEQEYRRELLEAITGQGGQW